MGGNAVVSNATVSGALVVNGNSVVSNATVSGALVVNGNATMSGSLTLGGNTISPATAGYLGTLSSNVQSQLDDYSSNPHSWSAANAFSGNIILGPSTNVFFPITTSTTTLANCAATNDPILLIDSSNNIVSAANAQVNISYQICTLRNATSMYYILIHQTPGVVGTYLNAYNAATNTTQYSTANATVNGVAYVLWGCPFTLNNNTITMYMYGLDNSRIPYLPATQYAKVVITNTNTTLPSTTLSYLSGATSNVQSQIDTLVALEPSTAYLGASNTFTAASNTFNGNLILGNTSNVYFPTKTATTTLANCAATNDPIQFLDPSDNLVSVANAQFNTTYQICTLRTVTSMYYTLIHQTPGILGTYLNEYNAASNTTQYSTANITINGLPYAVWGYFFTLSPSSIITMYMYGLDNSRVPYLPATQYAKVVIKTSNTPLTSLAFSYLTGATNDIQSQIDTLVALEPSTAYLGASNTFTAASNTFSGNISAASVGVSGNLSAASVSVSGNLVSGSTTLTPTAVSYLSGITSSVQSQLTTIKNSAAYLGLANTFTAASNTFTGDVLVGPSGATYTGTVNAGVFYSYNQSIFAGSGLSATSISATSKLTLTNMPCFIGQMLTETTMSNTTGSLYYYLVNWDTVVYNRGSGFNAATGHFFPNSSGLYRISGTIYGRFTSNSDSSAKQIQLNFLVNGVIVGGTGGSNSLPNSTNSTVVFDFTLYMAAGANVQALAPIPAGWGIDILPENFGSQISIVYLFS